MDQKIGEITHYFSHISVGIVELTAPLTKGASVHIKGHTTDFTQLVDEIQIDHKTVDSAKKGDVIGIKVKEHVREGDEVFLV